MCRIDQTDRGMEALEPGGVEYAQPENQHVFQVRLEEVLTEEQSDKVEEVVQDLIAVHGDLIPLEGFGDTKITLGMVDDPEGQSDLHIFFEDTTTTEALVTGHKDRRDIFVEFFKSLQEATDNKYTIFFEDITIPNNPCIGFGIQKEGLFPIIKYNHVPKDENKVFIDPADYFALTKGFAKLVKEADGKQEDNPQPWIFEPYQHEQYHQLVAEHKKKMEQEALEADEARKKREEEEATV